jgi:hypothetical protein
MVFIGPAEIGREPVPGSLRNVVDALSEVVDAQRLHDPHGSARLVETAEAAYAWALTVRDCRALEAFSFDPSADPMPVR